MSNNTLDALIAKVKSEAIESAEKESQRIIDNAKQQADQILKNTQAEKLQLLKNAQTESEAILNKGETALQQAARDVNIAVKNDILKLFKSVLEAEIESAFTPDLYATVISKIIDAVGNHVDVALPESLQDQMVDAVRQKVTQSNNTIEILKSKQLLSGLSVTKTHEGWTYDITAQEVSELLSRHLSQKWVDILNKA